MYIKMNLRKAQSQLEPSRRKEVLLFIYILKSQYFADSISEENLVKNFTKPLCLSRPDHREGGKMNFFMFGLLVLLAAQGHGQDHGKNQDGVDDLKSAAPVLTETTDLTVLGENRELREMDMILANDQRRPLKGHDTSRETELKSRKKRVALSESTARRWTNKVIPYIIDPDAFDRVKERRIHEAIDEWERHTCIKFIKRGRQRNFVLFKNGTGCTSNLGMVGGKQETILGSGCRAKSFILHEIGHLLGLGHEHRRPDRDNHIKVLWENMPKTGNAPKNFRKYKKRGVNTYGIPYDFHSVMHYHDHSFGIKNKLTMKTLEKKYQSLISRYNLMSRGLSFGDIKGINRKYTCDDRCLSKVRCPDQGFVGKDCKCYCPGNPVKLCKHSDQTKNDEKIEKNESNKKNKKIGLNEESERNKKIQRNENLIVRWKRWVCLVTRDFDDLCPTLWEVGLCIIPNVFRACKSSCYGCSSLSDDIF